LRKAGASPVMLVSSHRRAIITEFKHPIEPQLNEELKYFDQTLIDLILVEGFKNEKFPKIELSRACLNQPFLYPNDPEIIAVASDILLKLPPSLHALDLNQPQRIAHFISHRFLT
ncbi:MAG: molybdopterin-guanine dinucleotide biosynthesis protein MobB, partial [Methylococcales bacterium]|nr:molybdopterin-guanine dinucleotide biosynthesis protein MobB [Methylococcales bacterium]